jgi:hypothetical protein
LSCQIWVDVWCFHHKSTEMRRWNLKHTQALLMNGQVLIQIRNNSFWTS